MLWVTQFLDVLFRQNHKGMSWAAWTSASSHFTTDSIWGLERENSTSKKKLWPLIANPTPYRYSTRVKWHAGDPGVRMPHLEGASAKAMCEHRAKEGGLPTFQEKPEVQSFMDRLLIWGYWQLIQSLKNMEQAKQSILLGQIWPNSHQFAASARKLGHWALNFNSLELEQEKQHAAIRKLEKGKWFIRP